MNYIAKVAAAALVISAAMPAYSLPPDIRLSPADGSELTEISEFVVSSGWLELKYNTDHRVDLLVNGRAYGATTALEGYEDIRFTLDEAIDTDGEYTIMIPEDTFLIGWGNEPNPLITFQYSVVGGAGTGSSGGDNINNIVPQGYVFTPAAGSEVQVLATFSIEATNDMFLTAASRRCPVTINGSRVDAVVSCTGTYDNILTWTLAHPVTQAGLCDIFVPAGTFFGYAEEDNAPFLVTVRVTGGETPAPDYYPGEVTVSPTEGVIREPLKRIAVMYPKLTSAYVGPAAGDVTVTDGTGMPIPVEYTLMPDEDDFNEAHVVWFELAEAITAEGEYTISFPAQCFEIAKYPSNWYSAPFVVHYTIDDSDAVMELVDDECVEWFNLQGMRVVSPVRGELYLQRRGTETRRVIF